MTETPGDRPQHDPDERPEGSPTGEEPGYWERQAQQPTTPYPQQPYPPGGYAPGGYGPGAYGPGGYPPGGYPSMPGQGPVQYAPDHPRATTSLVLGILGVVLCQVLGPFAWWMGKRTMDEIDAAGGRYGGRGAAQAGYVLGIVGTLLLALAVFGFIAYALFFATMVGGGFVMGG